MMSDKDFTEVGGAPEGPPPDEAEEKPGQWTQEAVSAMQSKYDKQIAATQKRVEEAEAEARAASAALNQTRKALREYDPQAAEAIDLESKAAEAQAELAYYREREARQEQENEARAYFQQMAEVMGVSPAIPEVATAIQMAIETGNDHIAIAAMNQVALRGAMGELPMAPKEPEAPQPPSNIVLPGGGPAPPTDEQAERIKEYRQKRDAAINTKDRTQILALRTQFADILHLV
jgi:hypothetical protein